MSIEQMLKQKSGIRLDIGCGEGKQKGFVGIDKRKLEGVDIVHDLEVFPWPLPDECCLMAIGSHIVEHIKPWLQLDFINEVWRIMKPGCQLALSYPYGVNDYFVQDPTHCAPVNVATWQYYDPKFPLYQVYKPKPWKILANFWEVTGMGECVLEKMNE